MKRTPPSIAAELNVPTPNPAEDLGKVRMEADSLVLKTAVSSRLLVALVASLSVYLVGPYDSSTKLVVLGLPSPLQCAANWDGAWFTSLADEGYQYEQSHAFFPLMPLTMRVVANTVLLWLRPLVSSDAALLALSGAVVSNVCLIWSAVVLFRLGEVVFKDDPGLALRAALLFCFNPASIFFSVSMTESVFAFLALLGMWVLETDQKRPSFASRVGASCLFALATTARSNGVLLCLHSLVAAHRAYRNDARALGELAVVGLIHLLGLGAVMGFGWFRFCYARVAGQRQPWCEDVLPDVYSFVQKRYWNVGPFQYYSWAQAPNFVLALPTLLLGFGGVLSFARSNPAHALHLFVSLALALVVMHVQVVTRFLCASTPAFYWFTAQATRRKDGASYLILLYFSFYVVLGTAMFCNFFPWTGAGDVRAFLKVLSP